jgi:hypothetical protein
VRETHRGIGVFLRLRAEAIEQRHRKNSSLAAPASL